MGRKRVGIERTGLFGMFFLVTTSSAAVLSNFLPGSPFMLNFRWSHLQSENVSGNAHKDDSLIAVCVLMSGIIAARFGLWITDLTINQILQERVEEERRGVINGVQDSMNNSLDLLKCVLVILLPQPRQFGFLDSLLYLCQLRVVDVRSVLPSTERTPLSLLQVEEGADIPMKRRRLQE